MKEKAINKAVETRGKMVNVDGVMRPTTNSEGNPIAQTLAGIRNFYKWFGDSKVVDDQGRPMVMYHATGKDFNEFYPFIYLTKDPLYAERIGEALVSQTTLGIPRGLSIMPVYAKIENYADFRYLGGEKAYSASEFIDGLRKSSIEEAVINKIKREAAGYEILRPPYGWVSALRGVLSDSLSEGGYSGIVLKEYTTDWTVAGKQSRMHTDAFIAFSPNQIKSATGNNGNFDPDDFNIMRRTTPPIVTPLENVVQNAADRYSEDRSIKQTWDETRDQMLQFWKNIDLPIKRLQEEIVKLGGN